MTADVPVPRPPSCQDVDDEARTRPKGRSYGMDHFPFREVGLRCNPFRRLTDEEWAAVAVVPSNLLDALEGAAHLQILGGAGRGKTTCLLGLVARLADEGKRTAYEYLAARENRFRTGLEDLDVFLLDEAQRLTRRERIRLLAQERVRRRELRLVVATHEDLASPFARQRLPLVTVSLDSVTAAHVAAVVNHRIGYFSLDDPPAVALSADAVRHLCNMFDSNLRLIDGFLYEFFQTAVRPGVVTSEILSRFHQHAMSSGALG
jgi:hypothetical protein